VLGTHLGMSAAQRGSKIFVCPYRPQRVHFGGGVDEHFSWSLSLLAGEFAQNGPERSRARRCWARRSEPLTARTVLRPSAKRERLLRDRVPMAATRPPRTVVSSAGFSRLQPGLSSCLSRWGFLVSGAQTMHPFVALRATGYRVQTRPAGRGGLPNQCSGPLMTNAVTEPTRQLSLALQKLPIG
jgi:hypothetical protein